MLILIVLNHMVRTAYIVVLSRYVPIMAYNGIHGHTIVDKSSHIYSLLLCAIGDTQWHAMVQQRYAKILL